MKILNSNSDDLTDTVELYIGIPLQSPRSHSSETEKKNKPDPMLFKNAFVPLPAYAYILRVSFFIQ